MLMLLLLTLLQAAPDGASEGQRLYVVGPSDVLVITVYGQPQLTGKYTVEADGSFTFPLLGRVTVGGLSLRAIEGDLRDRLARGYLTDPQVSVAVDQYRSQQVFVMGEVRQPGALPLAGAMTLIEAIARAGSTTDRAGGDVLVVRSGNDTLPEVHAAGHGEDSRNAQVIRVNLQGLQGGELSRNVVLQAGDTVFVPRVETVFVSGQVRSEGEYVIRNAMTVRQALALAGGVNERGSTRRIRIVRQVDGRELTIDASLGDRVQPGDTIVVRERFF
jgi:polysaccharide biosynthesis/export protein